MNEKIKQRFQTVLEKEQVLEAESMSRHTTFRIGGPADLFVVPKSVDEIAEVLKICREEKAPYFILGNGSNLLVSDKGYRGVVVQLYRGFGKITVSGEEIHAQAGALLSGIAAAARDASLTGFEFAGGIPGTLGGAVVMNAGAYGGEMKDVLKEVTVLTPEGEILTLQADELHMGYRTSVVKVAGYIVLEAVLSLAKGDPEAIRSRMQEAYGDRWESVVAGEVDNCKMRYQFAENTNRFTARYGAGSVGLLDTLSFVDYCAIITKEVRIFGSGYRGWDEDWNILKKMRDINAHNNNGVLNRYTVQNLREACEHFDNWMEEVSHRPMPEEQPAEKPMVDERPKKVSEVVPDGESKSTKGNTVYNYKLLYRQEENDCELQVKVALNGTVWGIYPKDGKWPDGMDELEKTAKKEQILAAHTRRMRATETN